MSENDEDNQDQLSLKQELLKAEIIAKDYDGQEFLQYCIKLRENGDDMNNWTYEELKLVVQNFIGYCETKKAQIKKKENIDTQNNNNIEKEKIEDKNIPKKADENNKKEQNIKEENNNKKINKEQNNNKNQKDKMESKIRELSCKILEKSILNDKEIKVTIKNPKTNEKTLLSLPYVTYEVYTEPFCWLVRRRYSDFSLLRSILCKFFPRYLIPPLSEKKNWY